MLCKHRGVFQIRSKRTSHDQDGVAFRNRLQFIEYHLSELVTERFMLTPSAWMERFRGIDDEMVIDESSLDVGQPRL
jgi:hypothetical protein